MQMTSFSKAKKYTPDFNGNKDLPEEKQLFAMLAPLTNAELFDVRDALQAAGFKEKMDSTQLTGDQQRALVKNAGSYLPSHVTLTNNEGFDINDVVNYSDFLPLAIDLLFTLIAKSTPTEADVKN